MWSFHKTYFDDKPLEQLQKAITPGWGNINNDQTHLRMLGLPHDLSSVLEVGCGIGRMLKLISQKHQNIQCYGIDASKRMLEEARKFCPESHYHFSWCDGNGTFQHPPIKVDVSFAWLVFQHIPNIQTVQQYCIGMVQSTRSDGFVKCQLLKHNEFPDKPLWSWHNPAILCSALQKNGCKQIKALDISPRWLMIEAIVE